MVVSVMVPSMNQTNLVSVEYVLSGNMPWSTLTRDGSICYGLFEESNRSVWVWSTYSLAICLGLLWPGIVASFIAPSINQTDIVSLDNLLSCNMPLSILNQDDCICYGPFDESTRSGECRAPTLWQYAFVYSGPEWCYLLWFFRWVK